MLTKKERTYIDAGWPCPMSWGMALTYARVLLNRNLDYDDALYILSYTDEHPPHPAFAQTLKHWLAKQNPGNLSPL